MLPIIHFLRQSGKQQNELKTDLQKNFAIGKNLYPKTHQATLHVLDNYIK